MLASILIVLESKSNSRTLRIHDVSSDYLQGCSIDYLELMKQVKRSTGFGIKFLEYPQPSREVLEELETSRESVEEFSPRANTAQSTRDHLNRALGFSRLKKPSLDAQAVVEVGWKLRVPAGVQGSGLQSLELMLGKGTLMLDENLFRWIGSTIKRICIIYFASVYTEIVEVRSLTALLESTQSTLQTLDISGVDLYPF